MIYRLRKKFVMITAVSVGIVFALIFGGIYFISRSQLNHSLDMLADVIQPFIFANLRFYDVYVRKD